MTPRQHLLDHLFAQLKTRAEKVQPTSEKDKADFIAGNRMPVQARAAGDPSRRKSVRCPRRAGKSWYVLSEALEGCLRKKNSVWVVVGLTRPSVKQIFWALLKQLNRDLELGLTFLEVELTATFFNGSTILFRGAESRSEIEKLRGGQYDGVIIDECKSFHPLILSELVQDVIEPALSDRRGKLILVGTPGEILAGPFYEATCEPPIETLGADGDIRYSNCPFGQKAKGTAVWSFHTWTLQDNIEMPHLWAEALEIKRIRGYRDDHPTWRREFLGHWVASNNILVYRYVPSKHNWDGFALPDGHEWRKVLALDIGYHDADAICVWAYSPTSYHVYNTYAEKRRHQNITELAKWIQQVRTEECANQPEVMTGDFGGLATKVFAELAETHGLAFEPAEKKEKNDFIEIMNNEYDAERIHILYDESAPQVDENGKPLTLSAELLTNRWLEKTLGTPKKTEDPKTPNDLCDAHLYGWRWCDHRRAQPPERRLTAGSTEWWLEKQKKEFEAALAIHMNNKSPDEARNMDNDWWENSQDSTYVITV
jgi:hypothetical protein